MSKPHYQANLNAHLADCELNYLRLRKLLPDKLSAGQQLCIGVGSHALHIDVRECAPYTSFLEVSLAQAKTQGWSAMRLQLRIYHDAKLAEVTGSRQVYALRQRYDYPNKQMFHRDEKAQLNRFLGEWLSQCLAHGHRSDITVTPSLDPTGTN